MWSGPCLLGALDGNTEEGLVGGSDGAFHVFYETD